MIDRTKGKDMVWNERAMILTALVFTLLFALMLFMGFVTPLPLPAEQGILINFGDSDVGSGTVEPRPSLEVVKQPEASQPTATQPVEEQPQLTQDFEEAPAVQEKKVTKPKNVETKAKPVKKKEKPKEVVKPVVNTRALYGRNRNTQSTNSEGEAGGLGNQGNQSGDVNVVNRSLGSSSGDGISFSLAGRAAVRTPRPKSNHQKEGTVVVQITVDRSGKVVKAIPGVKGSTTLDSYLLSVAKRAALASTFNRKEDAAQYQQGTITYVFRLR